MAPRGSRLNGTEPPVAWPTERASELAEECERANEERVSVSLQRFGSDQIKSLATLPGRGRAGGRLTR